MNIKLKICKYYGKDEIRIGDISETIIGISFCTIIFFITIHTSYTYLFTEKYIPFILLYPTICCYIILFFIIGMWLYWTIIDYIKWVADITVIECKKK